MNDSQVLRFRNSLSLSARSVVSTLYFDSHAWMATALQKDRESGRTDRAVELNHHVLNIATVSAGFAIELVYKALTQAEGGPIVKKHEIVKLHNAVPSLETKRAIETFLKELGWRNAKDWLEFMDNNISHSTRRYWNHDPAKEVQSGINFTTGIEAMTIPSIGRIHIKLSDLARQRIWQNWQSAPLLDIEGERGRDLVPEPAYGVSRGTHIATIDIPEGFAEEGKMLGGFDISPSTGRVTIIPPETDENWERRKGHLKGKLSS